MHVYLPPRVRTRMGPAQDKDEKKENKSMSFARNDEDNSTNNT